MDYSKMLPALCTVDHYALFSLILGAYVVKVIIISIKLNEINRFVLNHINILLNYNMQPKKSSKYLNVYKKTVHE